MAAGGSTVVTGGSGYVGVNLVAHLVASGARVRVVDRARHPLLAGCDVEWVAADVRDAAAMRSALAGADVVYHLAAVISVAGAMGGLVADVNVRGLASVAAAARQAGVRRLVYCGSVHAFDTDAPGPITETSPKATRETLPAYDRSKAVAEEALRREIGQGLDAVLVNPTGIIGPCDPGPSRTGGMIRAMQRGSLPALVAGGFDWVDVRDVVRGLVAACERGRTGENYLLAGHRCSVQQLAEVVADVGGASPARVTLPLWFARVWSPGAGALAARWPSPLLYTPDTLHALAAFPDVDDTKARTELGHAPRPIEETVGDLLDWFDSPQFRALHSREVGEQVSVPGPG